jgi:hypothetical protein
MMQATPRFGANDGGALLILNGISFFELFQMGRCAPFESTIFALAAGRT